MVSISEYGMLVALKRHIKWSCSNLSWVILGLTGVKCVWVLSYAVCGLLTLCSRYDWDCWSGLVTRTGSWSQTVPEFNVVAGVLSWAKVGIKVLCLNNVQMLSLPQTMRRQRTEVVVELRKVITFVLYCAVNYKHPMTFSNYEFYNQIKFCLFICSFFFEIMYRKILMLSWISAGICIRWYFCSLLHRTKETNTFWRGEMCPMRTSVMTLMSTETSDRYGCVSSSQNVTAAKRKSSQHIFRFCVLRTE